ncbi:MAG: leucine-rich repeat protein [Ruminococcus sp.]|nr:leucine-rich repeat protein [Ruminococcus sp.]
MSVSSMAAFGTAVLMLFGSVSACPSDNSSLIQLSISTETQSIILDSGNYSDILGYDDIPADFSIPETVSYQGKEYTVAGIGCNAFSGEKQLRSLRIPETVRIIGDNAFSECTSLQSIEFSEGLTELGTKVFFSCSSLESVKLPQSLIKIGDLPFCRCRSLVSVEFPQRVDEIHSLFFSDCTELKSIVLPRGLKVLDFQCLGGLTELEEVFLPEGLEIIEHSAFLGCTSLKHIDIPKSVTEIGEGAFFSCSSLEEIAVPEGVTAVCPQTFSGCINLSEVILPTSLKTIGSQAFMNCSSLRSLVLPENLSSFGQTPFLMCRIEQLTIKNPMLQDIGSVLLSADSIGMICGFRNSSAQSFAEKNDIAFAAIANDMKGDANCDETVNMADAVMIMQALANPAKYGLNGYADDHITAQGIINADVSDNDGMTNNDALTISKFMLGIIDALT